MSHSAVSRFRWRAVLCSVFAIAVLAVICIDGEARRSFLDEAIIILAWICGVVLHPLENAIDGKREERSQEWPKPVNPLVACERSDDGRAKGSSWVDGCSGEVCAANVRDEDGKADAQGGQVRGAVLLHGKEIHGEDELCREEHFDEKTAGNAGVGRKLVGYEKGARQ